MITVEQRTARMKELMDEGLPIPSAVYGVMSSDRAPETLLRNWGWSAYL